MSDDFARDCLFRRSQSHNGRSWVIGTEAEAAAANEGLLERLGLS